MENGKAGGPLRGYLLDERGGAATLGWDEIRQWTPENLPIWVHLDRREEESVVWLRTESGLDPIVVEALLAEETRPRAVVHGDGMLVMLRGVNLNPGADPEDMISVRVWIDRRRMISVRARRLLAVEDMCSKLDAGKGALSTPDLLVDLAAGLIDRVAPVINQLEETADEIEEWLIAGGDRQPQQSLSNLRRQAISLRRYLAPQREALNGLQHDDSPWLHSRHKNRLREINDRGVRYLEDLDAVRERAAVIHDELATRTAEQMNKTMYVLTVVAAIMLPLGLITGLLGINVGGIPGGDSPYAFLIVCLLLLAIATLQGLIFRRLKWI